jgi:hypothetical protein
MAQVKRFDAAPVGKAIKLDNGFLKAPARLTRTGVFEYRQADGTVVRELRLPEEVFHPDSIASFQLLPLTDDHPIDAVTAENATTLAVGSIGEPHQDGDFLAAQLLVTSDKVVKKVMSGKQELSCGYFCDREQAAPGAMHDGKPYDFIQRNIRGNHVAIVDKGRAGPQAKIRLDSTDAVLVDETPTKEEIKMAKLTIDGAEFEVTEEVQAAVDAKLAKAQAEIDATKATLDAANASLATVEAEKLATVEQLKAATSPAAVQAAVAARVALEKSAASVLPEAKFDGLSEGEIKRQVTAAVFPAISLDGKSDDYVSALFEAALVAKPASNPLTDKAAALVSDSDKPVVKSSYEAALEKARAEFFKK